MMITRVIIIITGAWGGGTAKLHNWCLGLRGRSPITTNGDAEDDQDDLGGGLVVFIALMIMVLMMLMIILMSTINTNGDAGSDGDDQNDLGGAWVPCAFDNVMLISHSLN